MDRYFIKPYNVFDKWDNTMYKNMYILIFSVMIWPQTIIEPMIL